MPNLFEDEFTGRLDLSSEETAMYLYDVEPDESFPYHCSWSTASLSCASRTARSNSSAAL
jgi:hypothetical protein